MLKHFGLISAVALFGCSDREAYDAPKSDRKDVQRDLGAAEEADNTRNVNDGAMNIADNAQEFANQAAIASYGEIETSEVADRRSARPEIQQFARMMVKDHAAALEKLRSAASAYQLPTSAGQSMEADLNDLRGSSTDSFDSDYLVMQEKMHERAVELFEDYVRDGEDPNLKLFARSTLPTLRTHLDEVVRLRASFNGGEMTSLGAGAPSSFSPSANSNGGAIDGAVTSTTYNPSPNIPDVMPAPAQNDPIVDPTAGLGSAPLTTTDPASVPDRQPD